MDSEKVLKRRRKRLLNDWGYSRETLVAYFVIIYKYGRLNARRGSARDEFDQSEFSLSLTLSLSRLEPRGVRVPSRKHINQLFHVNTRAKNIALP